MPQAETMSAFHAEEADALTTFWKSLTARYGLKDEEIQCQLQRQQALANSLNRKATDELLLVTVLRRGSDSQSSRRQASTLFRFDTATV